MRREYIYFLILVIIVSFDFLIKFRVDYVVSDKKEILKFFNDNHLINVNGKVDLSEVRAIKDNEEDNIKKLYNVKDINYDYLDSMINSKKASNNEISKKIENLTKRQGDLDSEINSLYSQYIVVKRKYDDYVANLNSFMLANVPTINQYPNYNTGCESVALTILLRYNGVSVSPNQIIDSLTKTGLPYVSDGVLYGGNPEVEFVGNPYGDGYGVYHNPIADVANKYKSGLHAETNVPLSRVLEIVKSGHPVQVWSSMYLALPYVSTSWIYKETGEKIDWHANEHSVVVVGFTDSNIIISDPIGGAIKYQSRSIFESRYNYFGRRALYYL